MTKASSSDELPQHKFNTTVLVEEGSRVLDNNRTIQVYNLYFRLAGGFYVDSLGTLAGVPPLPEVVAEPRNDLAAELAEAVAVYNKTMKKPVFLLPIVNPSVDTITNRNLDNETFANHYGHSLWILPSWLFAVITALRRPLDTIGHQNCAGTTGSDAPLHTRSKPLCSAEQHPAKGRKQKA